MGKRGKHQYEINKKVLALSILRLLFLIALIISIIYIVKWYIDSKQNKVLEEKISKTIVMENIENEEAQNTKYKVDFARLKEINNETVAWLKVNGTDIESTVVKSNNNSYYLNHNFEKKYNSAGWIFADYRNKFDGTDKNIVIYGHNMKDNSMFGTLKNILKEEWYNNEENYIVNLITENEEQKYEVFSIYQIKSEDYYIDTDFKNNEFENFVETLKNRSVKNFNLGIASEDSILTLSTCANNNKYRVVLHAKKVDK
ncbi:MAG: class B sortase [Clostridia bacterium]|nr:class B sortase [Clostridia bacterium]